LTRHYACRLRRTERKKKIFREKKETSRVTQPESPWCRGKKRKKTARPASYSAPSQKDKGGGGGGGDLEKKDGERDHILPLYARKRRQKKKKACWRDPRLGRNAVGKGKRGEGKSREGKKKKKRRRRLFGMVRFGQLVEGQGNMSRL